MIDFLIKLLFSFLLSTNFYPFQPKKDVVETKHAINSVDEHGMKTGKWKYYGIDLPAYKYDVDKLVMEGNYKSGKREGEWIQYFRDGKTPLLIANYKGNRPAGKYKKFNSKGILVESGELNDGKYTGVVDMYYNDGKQRFKGNYYNGHENGDIVNYDQYGNIALSYTSYNDIINKETVNNASRNRDQLKLIKQKTINIDQKKDVETIMKNPNVQNGNFEPNGYNKIYNEQNDILQDGVFKNGKLYDGRLYQYDDDGILFKVKVYKNGIYVSDGQI